MNLTLKPKPTVREALTKEAIFQELKAESNVKAGSSPPEPLPPHEGDKFIVFNSGEAGDGDATFSFGGRMPPTLSEKMTNTHREMANSDYPSEDSPKWADAVRPSHGPGQFVLKKWEAKEVYARAMHPPYPPPEDRSPLAIALGNLFMGTIPNGHGDDDPKIIIACQARVDADNFWLRHASVPWAGSAQEQIAKAKGCPEDVIARVAL